MGSMRRLGRVTMAAILVFAAGACLAQTSGSAPVPRVALTFDDLPETGDLPKYMTRAEIGAAIVETLKAANAPQVYGFVNAGTLDDPEVNHLLERWREAGFLLGNHTYSHFNPDEVPLAKYEHDIARNEPILRKLMDGQDWHWFRYPYLAEGATRERRQAIRKYLHDRGYRVAEVTIDFEDSEWNDPYARCMAKSDQVSIDRMKTLYVDAANEAIQFAQARSQLLFHRDIAHVMLLHYGGFEALMLPRLIDILKTRRFQLITLPEAESDPVYAQDSGAVNDGGTLLDDLMETSDELEDPPHVEPPLKELDAMCR
jgi:peptidoglycan/xylan/chitin deacetylase (PgdA/CDA1 family)